MDRSAWTRQGILVPERWNRMDGEAMLGKREIFLDDVIQCSDS